MGQHLVLLGDSIFDNAAYVSGDAAVIEQARDRLPRGWRASLHARDGSVIADVHRQIASLPDDASHLVLSVGGNDALGDIGVLGEVVGTVGGGLRRLAEVRQGFEARYRDLLRAIGELALPTIVCTIYNPRFPEANIQREAVAALCLFNDAIIAAASTHKFPTIDLRAVCTSAGDYANAIEPSCSGGAKIAGAIAEIVLGHDFGRRETVLFP